MEHPSTSKSSQNEQHQTIEPVSSRTVDTDKDMEPNIEIDRRLMEYVYKIRDETLLGQLEDIIDDRMEIVRNWNAKNRFISEKLQELSTASFPMQQLDALETLDHFLGVSGYISIMINALKDNKIEPKYLLPNLIGRDVIVQYSWKGARGKKDFHKLKKILQLMHSYYCCWSKEEKLDEETMKRNSYRIIQDWLGRKDLSMWPDMRDKTTKLKYALPKERDAYNKPHISVNLWSPLSNSD